MPQAEILRKSSIVEEHRTALAFAPLVGSSGAWFAFNSDERGRISHFACREAWENYKKCVFAVCHGEAWQAFIQRDTVSWVQPALVRCVRCRLAFELEHDAISCPHCGQYYSASGYTILPPDMWEEPLGDDLDAGYNAVMGGAEYGG